MIGPCDKKHNHRIEVDRVEWKLRGGILLLMQEKPHRDWINENRTSFQSRRELDITILHSGYGWGRLKFTRYHPLAKENAYLTRFH